MYAMHPSREYGIRKHSIYVHAFSKCFVASRSSYAHWHIARELVE